MSEDIRHNPSQRRYEAWIDDELAGVASYRLEGDVAVFDHTVVEPAFGGRGVAGRLVGFALDDVRAAGQWRVRPACSFVVGFVAKHPDYADLLA
jgi:predicted GNAT family acetyltransferase